MKVLGVLLLFGLAAIATPFQERWERERDNTVSLFLKGMDTAVPLRIALGMPDAYELDEMEEDIKTKLGEKLRDMLDKALDHLKEMIEKGKEVKEKTIDRIKELKEKLNDLHEKLGDQFKEKLGKLKDKLKDYLKGLLDDTTEKEERAFSQAMELAHEELNLKNFLEKIKEMIRNHIDVEKIKEYIAKFKDSKIVQLLKEWLKKWKDSEALQKLRDLIRNLLDVDDNRERRSFQERWEEVKKFFKDKHIQLKEQFLGFGEWLKELIRKGLDVTKGKIETMKDIAREIITHSKQISKEVAVEALDALRPYKEDLRDLWKQLKDSVNEIVHRKDDM